MPEETPNLLKPGEAAGKFRVSTRTLARWAQRGEIDRVRLPGGQIRYREDQVRAMIEGSSDATDHDG